MAIEETGNKDAIPAHVTYISPQAEYSPPELYNRDNREKAFVHDRSDAGRRCRSGVHPGLPVLMSGSAAIFIQGRTKRE